MDFSLKYNKKIEWFFPHNRHFFLIIKCLFFLIERVYFPTNLLHFVAKKISRRTSVPHSHVGIPECRDDDDDHHNRNLPTSSPASALAHAEENWARAAEAADPISRPGPERV